jgi:hypothetical protein
MKVGNVMASQLFARFVSGLEPASGVFQEEALIKTF